MLENILSILFTMWLLVTLGFFFGIVIRIDDKNFKTGCLITLKDFIEELFWERNIFGIAVSVIIFIIAIPAILLVLMVQIVYWIIYLLGYIWDLGNIKENKVDEE